MLIPQQAIAYFLITIGILSHSALSKLEQKTELDYVNRRAEQQQQLKTLINEKSGRSKRSEAAVSSESKSQIDHNQLMPSLEAVAASASLDPANTANNDSSDGSSSRFDYTNHIALSYIWPVVPIGFVVLGTVANILSIIVFTRKEMRKFSSFCYFAFLNGINLAVLYVTMMRAIMEFNFHTDIRQLSLVSCKLHLFLTYFLSHLSSLVLCMISVDRVISVMFLRKAKDICTPGTAFRVTVGLVLFNFLLSSHILIFDSGHRVYSYEVSILFQILF
jgi:hypothetical protein